MPLHRDIHWIGRQWAVTGHGVQLIDQKLQGFFDIEVSKLWNEALIEGMHAKEWLNAADFEKALAIARARYKEPPATEAPPLRAVVPLPPVAPPPVTRSEPVPEAAKPEPAEPPAAVVATETPEIETPDAAEPAVPQPKPFHLRSSGRARFLKLWRVMVRKT